MIKFNSKFKLITFLTFSALILNSCGNKDNNNTHLIVYSCINCAGCVVESLNYIKAENLDLKYKIVMDTTCFDHNKELWKVLNIHHMPIDSIFLKFDRFGNYLLIDSLGKKTVFLSDMQLDDYL